MNSKPMALREDVKELMMSGMMILKQEDLLYDVQLKVEENLFPAHRFVLAGTCNYFRAMFTGNFKEAKEFSKHPVILRGISAPGFKVYLDFVYMANPGFTSGNIMDAINVAQMYQVDPLIKACEQFLLNDVDAKKFFSYFQIAKENNFQVAMDYFEEYKCVHFLEICKTEGFRELRLEEVTEYLKLPTLIIGGKEINVVIAARDWLEHDPDERMIFVAELLKCVNLLNLSIQELMHIKNTMNVETTDCQRMLDEAMWYLTHPFSQPLYEGSLLNNRGDEGMMLIPDTGFKDCEETKKEYKDLFKNMDTDAVTPFWTGLPLEIKGNEQENDLSEATSGHISKFDAILKLRWENINYELPHVQIGNFLFVFLTHNDGIDVLRYNPSIDKWMSLKSPPDFDEHVDWICVAQCSDKSIMMIAGGNLRSLGGPNNSNNWSGTVYRYLVGENCWENVGPSPADLDDHPTLAYHNSTVYVFAFYRLYLFDKSLDTWIERAPFQRHTYPLMSKYDPVRLISLNDKLYAFHQECIGEYDALSNQWTTLADAVVDFILQGDSKMPSLEWDFPCFVHNGNMYMVCQQADGFGEWCPAGQTYVYKFDMLERKFSVCQKISPWAIQCSLAAMVRAPRWL